MRSMGKSHAILLHSAWDTLCPLAQRIHAVYAARQVGNHLEATLWQYYSICIQVTHFQLIMTSKCKTNAGNLIIVYCYHCTIVVLVTDLSSSA